MNPEVRPDVLYGLISLLGAFALGGVAPDTPSAEAALLAQAARGVPSAVRIVTRRLTPVIQARALRVLRRLTPTHAGDADDIVQKVWVVLLKEGARQLLAFDAERGITLEAYVGMIAEREVRNHIQHELASTRRPSAGLAELDEAVEVATAAPGPEALAVSNDLVGRLDAHLMAGLAAKGQAIYRLVYTDARAPEEVATLLGCNVQVVYNWQHKIRALARVFLAEGG